MTIDPADRVDAVPPSGIRRFFEIADEREDVISLGVGEPDVPTPWAAREAAISSLERGRTSYTANRGLYELREAIAGSLERFGLAYDPDAEILVTTGASEAVDLAFRAIVDPGDTVAIAQPSYVSYEPGVIFAGGDVRPVRTRQADDFRLTVEALEAAGAAEADLLVYCYPNNPTGAVMSRSDLEPIADFVVEHDLAVLSDEIYAELTYGADHASIAAFEGLRERTIVAGGFSKAYAMTGLRLGYAAGPPDVVDAMTRIHQYAMLSAPTTAQHAAIEALESCEDHVRETVERYDRRRRFARSRFDEIGMPCFEAAGAFYLFPELPAGYDGSARAFAEDLLLERGVAVVPGDVFGAGGDGHLRVSYAASLEDLREALARIETFVADRA